MFLVSGAFEVAILRMVRYYSLERKVVLFFDTVLPMEAFTNTGNSMEMKFVSQVRDTSAHCNKNQRTMIVSNLSHLTEDSEFILML